MADVKPTLTITKKLPLRNNENNTTRPKIIPIADRIRALREELLLKDIKSEWEKKREKETENPDHCNLNDNLQH